MIWGILSSKGNRQKESDLMEGIVYRNFQMTQDILKKQTKQEGFVFSQWIKEKAIFRYQTCLPSFPIYNNFIYWCNLGINIGSEQNKIRPVIIVRTEMNSPLCTIIPLTSERTNDKLWYHIDLENENSTALVEQLRVISKLRILNPYRKNGKLVVITKNDWNSINLELKRLYCLKDLEKS